MLRKQSSLRKTLGRVFGIALIAWLLVGCILPASVSPTTASTPAPILVPTSAPTVESRADGLSEEEVATLSSLEKIDDYPLYTMRYYGAYDQRDASAQSKRPLPEVDLAEVERTATWPAWSCSLFAALGDAEVMLYGRNFDWEYSPALLLFTDPPDGYASVSMVDIAYLGFGGAEAGTATELPLVERRALLYTPFLPFDGMNERGLVVGMAAVPPGQMRPDPEKETVDSLMAIRVMLDRAGTVDEAVAILGSYNINMTGGPPLHYLIADLSGRSALVEFYQGEMVVMPNEAPWHVATNFLRASAGASPEGECWRYDKISRRLSDAEGRLTAQEAIDLLAEVSQEGTQWSVVYGMGTRDVKVIMGRGYDNVHSLPLSLAGE
jgi:hypothetical protein